VLRRLGGFDESLIRNQDYELNVRIRAAGEVVWFDPTLEVIYRPRSSLRGLASQYWQYGRWKRVTVRKHPGSLRWRQALPPMVLLANGLGLLVSSLWLWTLLVPGGYLIGVVVAALATEPRAPSVSLRLLLVFPTIHHAWAAGFLAGVPRHEGPASAVRAP
jgi:GT2 family glycosyltransferase